MLRRASLMGPLLLGALCVPACSQRTDRTGADDAARGMEGRTAPVHPRCRLAETRFAYLPSGDEGLVAVSNGPHGPRMFGRERWWDGAASGPLRPHGFSAIAWAGGAYVALREASNGAPTFHVFDPELTVDRALASQPPDASEARLIELPLGVAAVYVHRSRTGRSDTRRAQLPFVALQRFDRSGAAVGMPTRLYTPETSYERVRLRTARWDAGRIVVEYAVGDEVQYSVTRSDGVVLGQGEGAGVVCPRAGCVRLRDGRELGRYDGEPALRYEVLGREGTYSLPLAVRRIAQLAVHGDLVLLRFIPSDVVLTEDLSLDDGSSFAVLDLARREVVTVQRDPTAVWDPRDPEGLSESPTAPRLDPSSVMASWSHPRVDKDTRLLATARGFFISSAHRSPNPVRMFLRCD